MTNLQSDRRPFLITLSILLLTLSLPLFFAVPVKAAEESQYFPETGKTVSGKFLQYWRANGGLPVYGYPITEAQPEVDPETGKTFLTQWFERNRFELHPENAGTRYEVLLGLLGKDLKREALTVDANFVPANPLGGVGKPGTQQIYFNETHHNLSYGFLAYWQQNGGLTRFGYPISEEYQEIDPETSRVFTVQWFERARFEHHPENTAPYDILLGLLGKQIKSLTSKLEVVWQIQPVSEKVVVGLALNSNSLYLSTRDGVSIPEQPLATFIVKLSKNGQFQANWNLLDKLPFPEHSSTVLAVDDQEQIYVVDNPNNRIIKVDKNKNLTTVFTTWEQPNLPPNRGYIGYTFVSNIAVDSAANVYLVRVSRSGTTQAPIYSSVIEKFDSQGNRLLSFASSSDADGSDGFYYYINGIAIDRNDNVYTTDVGSNSRIRKFDSNGNLLARWGSKGGGDGQFSSGSELKAIAVDGQNNVYTLESGEIQPDKGEVVSRIQKFSGNGNFIAKWDNQGSAAGQFNQPQYMAVDPAGNIFIIDNKGKRLQKFRQN